MSKKTKNNTAENQRYRILSYLIPVSLIFSLFFKLLDSLFSYVALSTYEIYVSNLGWLLLRLADFTTFIATVCITVFWLGIGGFLCRDIKTFLNNVKESFKRNFASFMRDLFMLCFTIGGYLYVTCILLELTWYIDTGLVDVEQYGWHFSIVIQHKLLFIPYIFGILTVITFILFIFSLVFQKLKNKSLNGTTV